MATVFAPGRDLRNKDESHSAGPYRRAAIDPDIEAYKRCCSLRLTAVVAEDSASP